MVTMVKYIAVSFMMMVFISSGAQEIRKYPRIRALLMETQLAEIKKKINIDSKNVQKFDQLYREYIKEVSELNSTNQVPQILDSNFEQLSDQELEDIFIKQTDKSKRLLILREKYFYEFKTVMKPRDIIQMYRLERDVVKKVQMEMKNRLNNR